jgi:hypothetical protein
MYACKDPRAGSRRLSHSPGGVLSECDYDVSSLMQHKTLIGTGVDRLVGPRPRLPAQREQAGRRPRAQRGIGGAALRALFLRFARGETRDGRRWPTALGVAAIAALGLAVLSLSLRHETVPRGDDLIYERMARDPFGAHTFPFAYRIGVPWLAHVLPFGHTVSFELLAWLAAGGAAGFAYLLMRRLHSSAALAVALALALALSPPMLVVGLREGRNLDAATLLFMTAATLFVVERRLRLLAVTLALGVLVREAELFVIPLAYAIWAGRSWDPGALRRACAVGAPAVAVYVGLRLGIQSVGSAQVPGYGGSLIAARLSVVDTGLRDLLVEARRGFSVYGPLWIAAPLALASMPFARRGLVLVAACLLSMTFALDWGRMIFLAAPVFYPAGAFTLTRHPRWRIPALAAFALLIVAYAVHMDRSGVQAGILEGPPPPYPVR